MKKSVKNTLAGLGMSDDTIQAIENNFTGMTAYNITVNGEIITFETIKNFGIYESITLDGSTYPIWEALCSFKNQKNATNVLMAIAEGTIEVLDSGVFEKQSNITPKVANNTASYNEFVKNLSEEQLSTLKRVLGNWFEASGFNKMPNFFGLNVINDGKYERGQYVLYSEEQFTFYAKVLHAGNNGWVLLVDGKRFFTLTHEMDAEIIDGESIPKKDKTPIDERFDKYSENAELERARVLDNMTTKIKKVEAKKEKNFETYSKRVLKTPKQMEKVAGLVSTATLDDANRAELLIKIVDKAMTSDKVGLVDSQKVIDNITVTLTGMEMDDTNRQLVLDTITASQAVLDTMVQDEKEEEYNKLRELKLDTLEAIEEAVDKLNAVTLDESMKQMIEVKIREAKEKLTPAKEVKAPKAKAKAKKASKAKAKSRATSKA